MAEGDWRGHMVRPVYNPQHIGCVSVKDACMHSHDY